MYSYESIFSCIGGGNIVDMLGVFASLSYN